jgi:hypothetical protein
MRKTKYQRMKEEKILLVQRWCLANGWVNKPPGGPTQPLHRYKHVPATGKTYRLKFMSQRVRYEVQSKYAYGATWVPLAYAPFADIHVNDGNHLCGLTNAHGSGTGQIMGGKPIAA